MTNPSLPASVAVGPPDMSRLSGGQRVLDAARNDLANHLDSQIMAHKVLMDQAQAELQSNADYVIANGEVALQNARQALDRRINLTLGNAILAASKYGIEMPSVSEIRTRSSFPPPAILQAGPGKSPVPPINEANPYAGWADTPKSPSNGAITADYTGYNCNTETLPESERENFRFLWWRGLDVRQVVIAGPQPLPAPYVAGPIFTTWYRAHLACKLVNDCGWDADRLARHKGDIEAVQLADSQAYVGTPQIFAVCDFANEQWK